MLTKVILPKALKGLNGALGLYSSVKGVLDKNAASKKAKELRDRARADEEAWYRRNYYESFIDSTAARAAMKRVENSLRRNNEQNRAHSLVMGATPEYSLARNEQGLRSMENVVTNLAAQDDSRKNQIEAVHRQNKNAFLANELNDLALEEKMAMTAANNGYNLFQNALLATKWGNEKKSDNSTKGYDAYYN
jgi:primosomal protein N'